MTVTNSMCDVYLLTYYCCSLKKSVSLINQLDAAKFSPMLLRIVQKIHMKVSIRCIYVKLGMLMFFEVDVIILN